MASYVARTPGEGWPQSLLLYMKGEYKESELVAQVIAGDDEDNTQLNTSTDERLCEALYYVGEAHWARGNPEVARCHGEVTERIRIIRRLDFTQPHRIDKTYDEHAQILRAVIRRRADEANRLLRSHIEASKAEVRKITLHRLYTSRAPSAR